MGKTKTKKETTIILEKIPDSTGNETAMVKEVTGLLIFGRSKKNIKTMALTTYYQNKHSMENSKKRTINKILNNDYVIA